MFRQESLYSCGPLDIVTGYHVAGTIKGIGVVRLCAFIILMLASDYRRRSAQFANEGGGVKQGEGGGFTAAGSQSLSRNTKIIVP